MKIVPLMWGRGLKSSINVFLKSILLIIIPIVRGRGLKLCPFWTTWTQPHRPPYAGDVDWNTLIEGDKVVVFPLHETSILILYCLFVGGDIERNDVDAVAALPDAYCPPVRGVDWNTAALIAAQALIGRLLCGDVDWNSGTVPCADEAHIAPLWGRGLKYFRKSGTAPPCISSPLCGDVDWNRSNFLTANLSTSFPFYAGTRIEIIDIETYSDVDISSPLWGRGSKCGHIHCYVFAVYRPLFMWGRGLKFTRQATLTNHNNRPSCGDVDWNTLIKGDKVVVFPLRETSTLILYCLFVEAWSEAMLIPLPLYSMCIALLWGAWIEILPP